MNFFDGTLHDLYLGWEVKNDVSGQSKDALRVCNVNCLCAPYPCTPYPLWISLPMCPIAHVAHTPCTLLHLCPIAHVPYCPCAPYPLWTSLPMWPIPHCTLCPIAHLPNTLCTPLPMWASLPICTIPLYPIPPCSYCPWGHCPMGTGVMGYMSNKGTGVMGYSGYGAHGEGAQGYVVQWVWGIGGTGHMSNGHRGRGYRVH